MGILHPWYFCHPEHSQSVREAIGMAESKDPYRAQAVFNREASKLLRPLGDSESEQQPAQLIGRRRGHLLAFPSS